VRIGATGFASDPRLTPTARRRPGRGHGRPEQETAHGRWPAGLRPAEIGAPRRNRTYNPLAGSRVIHKLLPTAPLLVRPGVMQCRSCLAMAGAGSGAGVSDDQSGDLIT